MRNCPLKFTLPITNTEKSLPWTKIASSTNAVSHHLLSRLTHSAVAILWNNVGEALNLSQEVVHGSQESGKWSWRTLVPVLDPLPPSGFSGLSSWFRSADEARLEIVVLKMKYWLLLPRLHRLHYVQIRLMRNCPLKHTLPIKNTEKSLPLTKIASSTNAK